MSWDTDSYEEQQVRVMAGLTEGNRGVYTETLDSREARKKRTAKKYEEAVALYAGSALSLQEIAARCGVTVSGLQAYLRRNHRDLILERYAVPEESRKVASFKIQPRKGPTPAAQMKYGEAVKACGSMEFIEYNVSQVARHFGVSPTGLANFMKVHHPDIPAWREKVRSRMGINDHVRRGSLCAGQYAEAVELYRTTEYTIAEVAELCHVSEGGLCQHLRFYHQNVIAQREKQRMRPGKRSRGERTRGGKKHEPRPDTEEKYAEALALYRDTALTMKDIVARTGVPLEGFRFYVHTWHKDLVLERSGIEGEDTDGLDIRRARKRMKSTAAKYAGAIARLKAGGCTTEGIAKEYGFCPETFRDYLHKHEPALAKAQGMTLNRNGKRVSRRSEEKYAEAIRIYETTAEPLKLIAARLGVVYNSLGSYIRRNCPEAMERHKKLTNEI